MKLHNIILIVSIGMALFVSYLAFGLMHYLNGPKIIGAGPYYPPETGNVSTHVFAAPPIGSVTGPVIVLNHTNTTETDRLPNGTIMTFDIQNPFQKAHGDICKLPMKLRPGIVCSPEDTKVINPNFRKIAF